MNPGIPEGLAPWIIRAEKRACVRLPTHQLAKSPPRRANRGQLSHIISASPLGWPVTTKGSHMLRFRLRLLSPTWWSRNAPYRRPLTTSFPADQRWWP